MGIPSYFRRILQAYPGCLARTPPSKAHALAFDFNCLIYRCLRAPAMAPFPGLEDPHKAEEWERGLCEIVCQTVKEIWAVAGKPSLVFLAIDGVVPMAKIRQQRVRRFKSSWLRHTFGAGEAGWDSNAITPGTAFMDRLSGHLAELVKQHGKGWILSDSREPGEGEHKIMEWLRETKPQLPVIVYGLDADLIILSLLSETPIWLLREKQEFGLKDRKGGEGQIEYQFLDIGIFKGRLGLSTSEECINYCGIMSLMGNDFLPHSLTHKLNDDGHECVLELFKEMKQTNEWLVADGSLVPSVFQRIVKKWGGEEDMRIAHMIQEKRRRGRQGLGKGMEPYENLPIEWNAEARLEGGDWRSGYWSFLHPCATQADKSRYCAEYLKGFQWILDYYTGKPVNKQWMFSAWLPPLWSDFLKADLVEQRRSDGAIAPIQPEEQLAMVLPLESWGLIRNSKLRTLPTLAPQFWPARFGFLSLGRRYLWECEALIPVLTAGRIRDILNSSL